MVFIPFLHDLVKWNLKQDLLIPFSFIFSIFNFDTFKFLTYYNGSEFKRIFFNFIIKIASWYVIDSVSFIWFSNNFFKLLLIRPYWRYILLILNICFKYIPSKFFCHYHNRKCFKLEWVSNKHIFLLIC